MAKIKMKFLPTGGLTEYEVEGTPEEVIAFWREYNRLLESPCPKQESVPEKKCWKCQNRTCREYSLATLEERRTKYERWLCSKSHSETCQAQNFKDFIELTPLVILEDKGEK